LNDQEKHQHCMSRFIELANQFKDEGHAIELISAAMMSASGVYATYVAAGNHGALEPSGVDKIVALYRKNLETIQEKKREKLAAAEGEAAQH